MASYKTPLARAIKINGGVGTAPVAAPAAAPAPKEPEKGDVRPFNGQNYQFQGGNPRDKNNWKPIT
jgi:hypothetical protein